MALIYHNRKVVEKALNLRMRDCYTFHKAQCGFRERHSVETAMIRLQKSVRQGCKFICVLDLE